MMQELGQSSAANGSQGRKDAVIALFLSLYLVLLAFFVVLNSVSTFQDVKVKAATESLSSAFSTLNPLPIPGLEGEEQVGGGPAFISTMTQAVNDYASNVKIRVLLPGRAMSVVIVSDTLFEPEKADFINGARQFIERIVKGIKDPEPGISYMVEFLVGTDYVGDGKLPVGQNLSMSRAGVFARALLEYGAPKDAVSVGIRYGNPDFIELTFRVIESKGE